MSEPDNATPFDSGDLKVVMYRLRILEEGQRKLEEGQSAILEELRNSPRCPAPGACIELQKTVSSMEARVSAAEKEVAELREDRARVQGAGWAAKLVWGLITGLISTGVIGTAFALYEHVSTEARTQAPHASISQPWTPQNQNPKP